MRTSWQLMALFRLPWGSPCWVMASSFPGAGCCFFFSSVALGTAMPPVSRCSAALGEACCSALGACLAVLPGWH